MSSILKNFKIFFTLLLIIFLSSCSHTSKNDGAPNYNVDVSKIPNAVPKSEPLAKYGNYKSYVVLGKRYYTLDSSRDYNEIGTASWYGTKFHARKTSSGEPYDMLGMTAAHKSLPLPTYVEVTNLTNDKKIIVKVNDRGPFAPNRIIDLSYVAAKKLGMLGHGTAQVRVRAIDPDVLYNKKPLFAYAQPIKSPWVNTTTSARKNYLASETTYPTFRPTSKSYAPTFLQVGAFRNKSHALQLQKRLSSLFSAPVKISARKGTLYRVKIGPLRDVSSITQTTHKLKKLGITPSKSYGA